ncbi:TonB-dependent receptor [Bacteroidota bacterium]
MKSLHNLISFFVAVLLFSSTLFAQVGGVQGTVTSTDGEALIGANVVVEGTTIGAATNVDGFYSIRDINVGSINLIVTMLGYQRYVTSVDIVADRMIDLDVELTSTSFRLSDVVVKGNIAKNRETPVAFTDVSEEHIRKSFNVQDVPHLFANTPGIYITSDGGSGMGDSQVKIRGFDEQRIAVMINNVPVNDPESKKVYWSNWGSLPAAAQSIQVQRGVGSSLYGSGALGGSINVITKDAPAAASLGLTATLGQYGIMKYGVDYNSGLSEDNMAFIGRVNYMQGNGWRQSTYYEGIQYYLSGMWFPDENNTFKVIIHGAPQYHAYSYYGFPAEDFARYGRDWNGHPHVAEGDLEGTAYANRNTPLGDVFFMRYEIGANPLAQKGGVVIGNGRASFDNNVYHKPQFEIHHSLKLNSYTSITSTAFLSKGYGFGENINGYYRINRDDVTGNNTWADIMAVNSSSFYQYRNYSDHFQMGILSSLQTKLFDVHDFTAGVEIRWWKAGHQGEILSTFSRDNISYYIGNVRQTFSAGDFYYDYTTTKPQYTGFVHALWRFGDLSVMTDVQVSYMKYNIKEGVPGSNNYPNSGDHGGGTWTGGGATYSLWDFDKTFDYISPKIGVNYNVTESINVFANWSRAVNEPRVKYFFGYGSPNDLLKLEETSDIEVGAGYIGELGGIYFDAKYNFYNIEFDGKALQILDPLMANTPGYDYKGRRYLPIAGSTYRGHEIAINVDVMKGLQLGVNASISDNLWGEPSDSEGAQYLYSSDDVVAGVDYTDADGDGRWDAGEAALHQDFIGKFGEKVEVGMPQTILGATLNYTIGDFWISGAWRYYQDIYVLEDNSEVEVDGTLDANGDWTATEESAVLPSWSVIDLRAGFDFTKMLGVPLYINVHVANLLDAEYWQKGDSYGVLPGAERTIIFNTGITL